MKHFIIQNLPEQVTDEDIIRMLNELKSAVVIFNQHSYEDLLLENKVELLNEVQVWVNAEINKLLNVLPKA